MGWNTQFAFAVHALALLACAGDSTLKSEAIASSVNTNPVVIRRILCMLARAGLVTSQLGSGGGFRLGRSPGSITLVEVYRATEPGGMFCLLRRGGALANQRCRVGKSIGSALGDVLREANAAAETALSAITIEDLLRTMKLRPGPGFEAPLASEGGNSQ